MSSQHGNNRVRAILRGVGSNGCSESSPMDEGEDLRFRISLYSDAMYYC